MRPFFKSRDEIKLPVQEAAQVRGLLAQAQAAQQSLMVVLDHIAVRENINPQTHMYNPELGAFVRLPKPPVTEVPEPVKS